MALQIYHIDLNARNLRPEEILRRLKAAAAIGCNAILWEVESKVRWDSCPECAAPDAMSKQTFAGLLEAARKLGLEPIPLFQTIGHAEYVLLQDKYKEFRELPDHWDCYCTSSPAVRRFLAGWLAEYRELFGPVRYFHLGGDEAYVFHSCPACAARPPLELYCEHVLDIAAPLLADGVRPGVWSDMLFKYYDQPGTLPEELVVWEWNYWDDRRNPLSVRLPFGGFRAPEDVPEKYRRELPELFEADGGIRAFGNVDYFLNRGSEVILCGAAQSASDGIFLPRQQLHGCNMIEAARVCRSRNLTGLCMTDWSIRMNAFDLLLPEMAAAAVAYEGDPRPPETLMSETSARYMGDPDMWLEIERRAEDCDGFWRHFTAIQWSGFKDSLPPPPDWLEKKLAGEHPDVSEPELERRARNCDHLADGGGPAATAAGLQRDYLRLFKAALYGGPDFKSEYAGLMKRLVAFWSRTETAASARCNADLALRTLADYAERHPSGTGGRAL